MTHSVQQHLRIEIGSYDETIRRFLPRYDEMLDAAASAVAEVSPERVIDLGAGTGSLSERVLDRTSTAVVELWDVDDAMLAVARDRLARFGERARLIHRSFDEPFSRADAIMGSLSLHHIRSLEDKTRLYRRAAEALRPGGVLVNADITIPREAPANAAAYRFWVDQLVAAGIEERRAWNHFEEWSGEDRYFSLEEELDAMSAAGLEASCRWRFGPSTVVSGSLGARRSALGTRP